MFRNYIKWQAKRKGYCIAKWDEGQCVGERGLIPTNASEFAIAKWLAVHSGNTAAKVKHEGILLGKIK